MRYDVFINAFNVFVNGVNIHDARGWRGEFNP